MQKVNLCDKCSRPVSPTNDAVLLRAKMLELNGEDASAGMARFGFDRRHLFPVVEDGKVICEGSPSNAQYLEGAARDNRTEYPLNEDSIPLFRDAYRKLLGEHGG